MNRVSTLYYRKRDSCSDKMCRLLGYILCVLIYVLYIVFNISIIIYSYFERPEKDVNIEGYHNINTLILWNSIYVSCISSFVIPHIHFVNCLQSISCIVTSICLSVYWWAFPPEYVEHFHCSALYVVFSVIFSLQLFLFISIKGLSSKSRIVPSKQPKISSCAV